MDLDYCPFYIDAIVRDTSSAICYSPFDRAVKSLELFDYEVGFMVENVNLRIFKGMDCDFFNRGNITKESFIYIPNNNRFSKYGKFLTKIPLILESKEEITRAHENFEELYLSDEQVERALENAVFVEDMKFEVKKLNSYSVTAEMFGDRCSYYGDFLLDCRINHIPMFTAKIKDKPYARPCFFGAVGNKDFPSQINSCFKCLDMWLGVRGFKKMDYEY